MNGLRVDNDTVSHLSELYHVPREIIMYANDIKDDSIVETEYVFIPNPLVIEDLAYTGFLKERFIYPVQGAAITRTFGWERDADNTYHFHPGLDLRVESSTPVRAAMSGIVYDVGISPLHGKYVVIHHSRDYFSLYSRLSEVTTKENDYVTQGNKIGIYTGNDGEPYLHFGIFNKEYSALNPLSIIQDITGNPRIGRPQPSRGNSGRYYRCGAWWQR